jgi:hypothetical protein
LRKRVAGSADAAAHADEDVAGSMLGPAMIETVRSAAPAARAYDRGPGLSGADRELQERFARFLLGAGVPSAQANRVAEPHAG